MSDPFELPGLAHFCEHMLFLGTEKYPEESGFDKHVREHAGMANAYTDKDITNYYFDVAPDCFDSTLDRSVTFSLPDFRL
jgi:secreted Zn-dependent insulinase-like peptidase